MSRYDDRNIHMHAFDNGTGMAVRRDNWNQIKRNLQRKGFELIQAEVDEIMHCRKGAVVGFINRLYTFLTKRR